VTAKCRVQLTMRWVVRTDDLALSRSGALLTPGRALAHFLRSLGLTLDSYTSVCVPSSLEEAESYSESLLTVVLSLSPCSKMVKDTGLIPQIVRHYRTLLLQDGGCLAFAADLAMDHTHPCVQARDSRA
jgi:hypothetical protein